MNEDKIAGAAKQVGGQVQEAAGGLLGDAKTQVEGLYRQGEGMAQEFYGDAKEKVATFEDTMRDAIEARPLTALFAALAIGWVIGRTGRA